MECAETISRGLGIMGLGISGEARAGLCRYCGELVKWNRKMNLVGQAPEREIIETHFLDSLTLLPLIDAAGPPLSLLDVGAGAGFPGLVLKIARPDLALTLVEPRRKRVSFLRHVARTLALQGVTILNERLEKDTPLPGAAAKFPLITSRAFTSVAAFLELTAGLSPPGGRVVCMKGPRAGEEIQAWRETQPHSPYTLTELREWRLPFSKAVRFLALFTKND